MALKQIEDFSDQRHKAWCVYCGASLTSVESNRDHVPSKVLLRRPLPENLPVIHVCTPCNQGHSGSEEYLAGFLGAVLTGSVEPSMQTHPSAERVLRGNLALQRQILDCCDEYQTIGGNTHKRWVPDENKISRVVLKNAQGHVYFELGEPPLRQPDAISMVPLVSHSAEQRRTFEKIDLPPVWPEIGSRMMTRLIQGDGPWDGWIDVQPDTYRYAVTFGGPVIVRSVIWNYLATEVVWDELY